MANQDFSATKNISSPAQERQQAGKEKVQEVTGEVQQKAEQVVGQVRERAQSQLVGQKEMVAEQLGSIAQAFRETGQQLRKKNETSGVAQYTERIAGQIDQFSGSLRDKDFDEIVGDVEDLARREPALFLGGAAVLGFLAARFLKSSSRSRIRRTGYYPESGRYSGLESERYSPSSPHVGSYSSTTTRERTRFGS